MHEISQFAKNIPASAFKYNTLSSFHVLYKHIILRVFPLYSSRVCFYFVSSLILFE